MKLDAFSLSLAVKDLAASRDFYTQLGFEPARGDGTTSQIMRNETTLIGLFEGMLEENLLTFNPGWDHEQHELSHFPDVRKLRATMATTGVVAVDGNTEDSDAGPAHIRDRRPGRQHHPHRPASITTMVLVGPLRLALAARRTCRR